MKRAKVKVELCALHPVSTDCEVDVMVARTRNKDTIKWTSLFILILTSAVMREQSSKTPVTREVIKACIYVCHNS
jgi:hypothetical protein